MGIHSCNDEATCVNVPGSYNCRCDSGFVGTGMGQGETFVAATATAAAYWEGCHDIDDCDPALYNGRQSGPCLYGVCQDTGANSFYCECEPGWIDSTCDLNFSDCNGQCINGFCVDLGVNDYRCECDRGYKDKNC